MSIAAAVPKARLRTLAALPVSCLVALGIHVLVSKARPEAEVNLYSRFLIAVLAAAVIAAGVQAASAFLRAKMIHLCPILAAAVLGLTVWELITTGFHLLPLPYFPGPAAVLQSLL